MKLRTPLAVLVALALAFFAIQPTLHADNPVSGAVFTSDSTCSGVDLNIYGTQDEVYVDGGPAHPGAAGLPDGAYFVQVTEPDGTLLGTSIGTGNEQPIIVSGGEFANCYQLSSILKTPGGSAGYDITSNPGGEYKVWISNDPNFLNSSTKTDNFKVKAGGGSGGDRISITVEKFYDANANGVKDGLEPFLNNWKVQLTIGSSDYIRFTPVVFVTSPEDYSVIEFMPIQTNWVRTTQTAAGSYPVLKTVNTSGWLDTQFGNVCLGAGGGFTLGFWSNKNGQALVGADDLALLTSLNLVNATGGAFDPTTYSAFRTWILGATATNMAYMLSAQLAAMELNVLNGKVNGSSLVYAPGATSANAAGFVTVSALMSEANASLLANPYTVAAGATRTYQEKLKNALDRANNDQNFVQANPCAFNFPPD